MTPQSPRPDAGPTGGSPRPGAAPAGSLRNPSPAAPGDGLDLRDKQITTYIVNAATERLSQLGNGDVVEILAPDVPAVDHGLNAWLRMTGQRLVESAREADYRRYRIAKVDQPRSSDRFAMIISRPGLEELLSPLGFALAAALTGSEVHIFFQGPAVRVLKRGFKEKLPGLAALFSGFARRSLARSGHVPPQEKLHQLRALGARYYACGPSMSHFGVKPEELIFDDVTQGEYFTFIEVMRRAQVRFFLS